MQYWINHNGVQSGPMDLDGLKEMGLTSSAYVWHEGLTDWVKITQLPELQGLYDIPVGTPVEPQPVENTSTADASQPTPPAAAEPGEAVQGQPYQQPSQPYQQPYQQPSQPYQQPVAGEPCPPTNLAWAIITTVLCCLPAGVVAIIYALKVTNKYNEGDIEGAKRASEIGAWWCIASIILGILTMPLASMISSLATSGLQ